MLLQDTIQEYRGRSPKQTRTAVRHHVVIVVGGFGGVQAAKRLAGAAVDITLVDQ
jgi:heterodisulfide reductase subunit A-like polyferredoxin